MRSEDPWTAIMYNELPHQELVKCVVVGDTAVGKTRLICARACDSRLTLSQLMTTHIPTVWAIDQYRIYKEVLKRSWAVVDTVSVSLRLWDTFGDHDKDRRFAYGRSDVVLLCFSIANPISLRNCKAIWYPEIRQFCPNTPIILVGCKNDLRFMYRDEKFLSLCRDRSPFFRGNHPCVSYRFPEFGRPLKETDILAPEQGRLLAKEIGAQYYETSVLTRFGVGELFENVVRAALLARKQQRFWMTNLKHVQHPLLQEPFCPPKPPSPDLAVPPSQFEEHMQALFQAQTYTDAVFVVGRVGIPVHRWLLASSCGAFYKLFTSFDLAFESNSLGGRSASDSSVVSTLEASQGSFNMDTEQLIAESRSSLRASLRLAPHSGSSQQQHAPVRRRASCQIYPEPSVQTGCLGVHHMGLQQSLNHPAFVAMNMEHSEGTDHQGRLASGTQAVLLGTRALMPVPVRECLRYLYTGKLNLKACPMTDVQRAAELIGIPGLVAYTTNIQRQEEFLNADLEKMFLLRLQSRLKDVCLDKNLFADVLFQLDDGSCSAHRPLLMARCDVMAAMFKGDFRESSAKVVHFPGVSKECFQQLLVYLYTDSVCDRVNEANCLELIELANRLCLPRLVCLVEHKVIKELCRMADKGIDVTEVVLRLLEPCQVHNADQLADWCLYYIAISYNEICRKNLKLLRNLHPENQAYLNRNRWPPIWYLKENDFYERSLREQFHLGRPAKKLCFCPFSFKGSRFRRRHQ